MLAALMIPVHDDDDESDATGKTPSQTRVGRPRNKVGHCFVKHICMRSKRQEHGG
jgi:hypothetical protein